MNCSLQQIALDAVFEAARLTRRIQAETVIQSLEKSDRSPVTVADYVAQAVVTRRMRDAFSGLRLIAEEDVQTLSSSSKILEQVLHFLGEGCSAEDVCSWIAHGQGQPGDDFWTLDPVDGTKGFLRGEQYAIALAQVEKGRPTFAVLGCPNLELSGIGTGVVMVARQGGGALAYPLSGGEPVRLNTSGCQDPAQARVLKSYESAHTNFDHIDMLRQRLGIQSETVALDSQAKYGLLAAGGGELLLRIPNPKTPDYKEKIWDHAAGTLVVQEAGGSVTDLDGKTLDFSQPTMDSNRGVLASNGPLHAPALKSITTL